MKKHLGIGAWSAHVRREALPAHWIELVEPVGTNDVRVAPHYRCSIMISRGGAIQARTKPKDGFETLDAAQAALAVSQWRQKTGRQREAAGMNRVFQCGDDGRTGCGKFHLTHGPKPATVK